MRYLWDSYHSYVKEQKLHVVNRCIVPFFFNKIRVWDFFGANRVDTFVANSNHVAQRIQKYYQRDAEVIYPPIPVKKGDLSFLKESKEDYFLIVSRLSAYKYIDQAIKVCNNLKINLKIIGTGREELRLKSMAGPTIEFLGRVSDKELANYYKKAKALLFLSEEDFGMTMVEALGWGTPVIALGKGGATEIILSQIHGMLYNQENEKGLSEAIMQFRQKNFDREKIYQHALQFDSEVFKKKITSLIAR
jgi:glycosyltransferase involved in cell wall biosynthesis